MNNFPFRSLQPGRALLLGVALLLGGGSAAAGVVSDVRASKHNLSSAADGSATGSGTVPVRTVKATSETQVCVFCHTPHSSTGGLAAPLWNRVLSTATYTPYLSSSMDANPLPSAEPGAASKVCLSCHDGTLAIGMVSVLNLSKNVAVNMSGTGFLGGMPEGSGATTGFTRHLGTELGNDHPIAFNYDSTLSNADGELRTPPVTVGATTVVGNRSPGVKPTFPLDSNQMQCSTCHDPHLVDTTAGNPPLKFLRGNRLQRATPLGGSYVQADDIMCLACHDKAGTTWSSSVHANNLTADQDYKPTTAADREFPAGTKVWMASCLNCHDTHSVQGSRRLLREGTDSLATPKAGGNPAIEQTCFQCHDLNGGIIDTPNTIADIKSDFGLSFRMPVSSLDQGVNPEPHDIGGNFTDVATSGDPNAHCNTATDRCGKDFVESQTALGRVAAPVMVDTAKRHAECTDCHNPHRATKTRLFNDNAIPPAVPAAAGTHKHAVAAGETPHSNIASGSLRGTYGVEPSYTSNEFGANPNPTGYTVKRGDVATGASTAVSSAWVTREYQLCFKCHSNYAYETAIGPPAAFVIPPLALGTYGGGSLLGTNGVNYCTDVAMESQAPSTHKGAPASTSDSGALSPTFSANNHRSWHPATGDTGRTVALRGNASPNLWRAPWNGSNTDGGSVITSIEAVGNQTMYCSDCHGTDNALTYATPGVGSDPENGENGKPWGPHGSGNSFVLRGPWDTTVSIGVATDTLCFRCHDATQYADATGAPATTLTSGFSGAGNDELGVPMANLHQRHAYYTTQGGGTLFRAPPNGAVPYTNWPVSMNGSYRCTMCHTGTAHGWKNKAFLVNLDDLGLELNAGYGALGTELPGPFNAGDPVPKGTQAAALVPLTAGGYTNGPYYQGAYLRVSGFAASGTWAKTNCAASECHSW